MRVKETVDSLLGIYALPKQFSFRLLKSTVKISRIVSLPAPKSSSLTEIFQPIVIFRHFVLLFPEYGRFSIDLAVVRVSQDLPNRSTTRVRDKHAVPYTFFNNKNVSVAFFRFSKQNLLIDVRLVLIY